MEIRWRLERTGGFGARLRVKLCGSSSVTPKVPLFFFFSSTRLSDGRSGPGHHAQWGRREPPWDERRPRPPEMSNHERNKRLLLELLRQPHNDRCADCDAPGESRLERRVDPSLLFCVSFVTWKTNKQTKRITFVKRKPCGLRMWPDSCLLDQVLELLIWLVNFIT